MDGYLRLFIALEFSDHIKKLLADSAERLRAVCRRGSFTRIENFHLTLAFLGRTEQRRVDEIAALMDSLSSSPPVPVAIGRLGRFRRGDGDIIWRRVEPCPELTRLQSNLSAALRERGFPLEERGFVPHLTLARRAALKEGETLSALSDKLPELNFTARSMALMKSENGGGRLTYTPLRCAVFSPIGR